jgi:hypothetical protein
MAEIHQLTRSTTETLFLALQKRGAIRADLSIGDLTLVFIRHHICVFTTLDEAERWLDLNQP